MTIDDVIASCEREIRMQEKVITDSRAEVERVIALAKSEGRENLTAEEDNRAEVLFTNIERSKQAIEDIKAKLENARAIKKEEDESDRKSRISVPVTHTNRSGNAMSNYDTSVRIGQEARTYSPDTDPTGSLFINDLIADATNRGRGGASERLNRHMQEERVERPNLQLRSNSGVGTGAFSGLTVPAYLVDMVAPAIANLRPMANIANHHTLPANGMTVNISRITTPSAAGLQASELATVAGQDMDDTLLTAQIQTFAGSQLVSRQAIDRGAGIEETVVADLLRQVATSLDSTLISQSGTGALACGTSVAFTQSTPTADLLWPALFQAESQLEKKLIGIATPDYVVMRSDRWNWLSAAVSANHPWIAQNGQTYQGGLQLSHDYGTVNHTPIRGRLANGLPVICDNNLPNNAGTGANEDRILMVASQEAHLWEDAGNPVIIRAEQPYAAQLGVLLVAYEYAAFTFQRYPGNPAYLSGTGMVVTTALAGF